jgi:hypothetical protein
MRGATKSVLDALREAATFEDRHDRLEIREIWIQVLFDESLVRWVSLAGELPANSERQVGSTVPNDP